MFVLLYKIVFVSLVFLLKIVFNEARSIFIQEIRSVFNVYFVHFNVLLLPFSSRA